MVLFACFIFFLSCDENADSIEEMKQETSSSKIDTLIFEIDTLNYSFGIFAANEKLSVIIQPAHAKYFELSDNQLNEKVLKYAPKDDFLGTDSVVVLSKRILGGKDPFVKIDSVLFVISTVKDISHKYLIGKWISTQECGGYVGGCFPVDQRNSRQLDFGYNMRYTLTYNDSSSKSNDYSLVDSIGRRYVCLKDIVFDIKVNRYLLFDGDQLIQQSGDRTLIYSRLKE